MAGAISSHAAAMQRKDGEVQRTGDKAEAASMHGAHIELQRRGRAVGAQERGAVGVVEEGPGDEAAGVDLAVVGQRRVRLIIHVLLRRALAAAPAIACARHTGSAATHLACVPGHPCQNHMHDPGRPNSFLGLHARHPCQHLARHCHPVGFRKSCQALPVNACHQRLILPASMLHLHALLCMAA